jgi:death-on-curing protein
VNLAGYSEPDASARAAAYAFGLARNHSFVDGNKRTAFLTATTFLDLNGYRFTGAKADSASPSSSSPPG